MSDDEAEAETEEKKEDEEGDVCTCIIFFSSQILGGVNVKSFLLVS